MKIKLWYLMNKSVCFIVLLFISLTLSAQDGNSVLASPDGQLVIAFQTNVKEQFSAAGGALHYKLSFKGKPLIDRSALSLNIQGAAPLGAAVKITKTVSGKGKDEYSLAHGKTRAVRIEYNMVRIELQETEAPRRGLIMEARAYNDGVAFRYIVPEQAAVKNYTLTREGTEFRISKDATTYALELPNFRSMYESEFVKLPITAFSNQGGVKSSILLGLPLLMEVPGVAWMAIAEADLRDYTSMYLTNPSGTWAGHWFESVLAPQVEHPEVAVQGNLPLKSPWRVMLVAEQPGKLIESNIITSLNPPSVIKDDSWVKPGKSAWDWWADYIGRDGKKELSTENTKYYIDFAAKSGLEYMLIDAGWSKGGDVTQMNGTRNIPELVKYAKKKNVKIWIWASYASLNKQMEQAFPLFEKWGVAGVKTDFIERDDQKGMEFYYRLAEMGARHHLMVDFHGGTKPSGMERTYPNVIGYESVLGMEQSKGGTRANPEHHVTIPFTRMLLGLMDYTPGGFDNVTAAEFKPKMDNTPMVLGTRAHQLAMYVVFEAPFQMVSDKPSAYEGQPAFQFIKDVPSSWDEINVINGIPGEYITIARRDGDQWFLGSMTNWTKREFDIPLGFLGSGEYTAEIYSDAADAGQPKKVTIEKKSVNSASSLKLKLAEGGGCAVRFVHK